MFIQQAMGQEPQGRSHGAGATGKEPWGRSHGVGHRPILHMHLQDRDKSSGL